MKFKLDENLGGPILKLFRASGYDTMTVVEQNLCSAPDSRVIKVCREEERCLVTLDLDFANPFHFRPIDYRGIIVLRLPPRPSLQDMTKVINILLDALKKATPTGKLWVVRIHGVREYEP